MAGALAASTLSAAAAAPADRAQASPMRIIAAAWPLRRAAGSVATLPVMTMPSATDITADDTTRPSPALTTMPRAGTAMAERMARNRPSVASS